MKIFENANLSINLNLLNDVLSGIGEPSWCMFCGASQPEQDPSKPPKPPGGKSNN